MTTILSFINSIRHYIKNSFWNFFIGQQLIEKEYNTTLNVSDIRIESPHFIIERIIDSNIRLGIGSLYKDCEDTLEILKFNDIYLELIDFSKNIDSNKTDSNATQLQYNFANPNKNLYFKLIITKQSNLPQFNKKNLLEYKLINMQSMFYDVIVSGTIAKITVKNIGMDVSKNIDEIEKLF